MNDYSDLERLAEAAIDDLDKSGQRWPERDDWFEPELCSAELEFVKAANPATVLALIAENKALRNAKGDRP